MNPLILKTGAIGAALVFLFLLWQKQRNNYQKEWNQTNASPPKEKNKEKCFICYNEFEISKNSLTTLPCNHKFHRECVNMVFTNMVEDKRACPLCLKIVSEEFII